jgi:uncharacterized protein YxjI
MEGYAILNDDGEEVIRIEGDMVRIFEDRNEISHNNILVAVVPKTMLILRMPCARI